MEVHMDYLEQLLPLLLTSNATAASLLFAAFTFF